MAKMTISGKFRKFLEDFKDSNYEVPEEYKQEEIFDEIVEEPYDNTVPSTDDVIITSEDEGSGGTVSVVTPKGTSVSVTEKKKSLKEKLKESMVYSQDDIDDINEGGNAEDIINRRSAQNWNGPQKFVRSGKIQENFKKSLKEDIVIEDEDFYGEEINTEDCIPVSGEMNVDGVEYGFEGELKLSGEDLEISGLETGRSDRDVEEDPLGLDKKAFDVLGGDPIGESLKELRKVKENKVPKKDIQGKDIPSDAAVTNNKSDAKESPNKTRSVNGVNDVKEVKSQNADQKPIDRV